MIIFDMMQTQDWPQVREIYEEGIRTGQATFQPSAPEWEEWNKGHLSVCRLVAKENDVILGWAALSAVSARTVYAGVAEVSVYIKANERGKGLGRQLLEKLVEDSEANNIWTLQSSIFPENMASIKVHQTCGFRIIGTREKIGKMNGVWHDTILMERRSKKTELINVS